MDDYNSLPIGEIVDVEPHESTLTDLYRNGFTLDRFLPGNIWRMRRILPRLLTREEQVAELESWPVYQAQNAYLRSLGLFS